MNNIGIVTSEKQLLKSYIEDEETFNREVGPFFLSEVGRDLFLTMVELRDKGLSFSDSNLTKYGNSKNNDIGERLLNSLDDIDIRENEVKQYEHELREAYVRDQLEDDFVKEMIKISSAKDRFSVAEVRKTMNRVSSLLGMLEDEEDKKIYTSEETYEAYEKILESRTSNTEQYSSGDRQLNSVLFKSALLPGEISIVFGHPGSGKSTLVNNLSAKREGLKMPTIHVATEMSFESIMDTRVGIRTGIVRPDLIHLDGDDGRYETSFHAVEKLRKRARRNKNYRHIDADAISLGELEELNYSLKEEMGISRKGYLLLIVDLLTMTSDFSKTSGQRSNDYEDAMNELLRFAKRAGIHIMGVVQARRNDKKSFNNIDELDYFRPTLEQLKNSSALEERARVVIGIYRKKHFAKKYFPEDPELDIMDDILEAQILKQNSGDIGMILKYFFDPDTSKLSDFSEDSDDEFDNEFNEDLGV